MNSKWTEHVKLRGKKNTNLLEEKVGTNLHNFEGCDTFLNITPKMQAVKVKNRLHKVKTGLYEN